MIRVKRHALVISVKIHNNEIKMHLRARILLAVGFLGVAVLLAVFSFFSRAQRHADRSCLSSVFHVLSKNPSLLTETRIPVTNQWYELDEENSAVLIKKLQAERLLDNCRGLEKALAQGKVGGFMKLRVMALEDGSRKVWVTGAGFDQQLKSP
jgi:hypothetical protein